ncbi:hypothetical protein SPB21_27670 [Leptothoe sp. ISB3NOV94-8A]
MNHPQKPLLSKGNEIKLKTANGLIDARVESISFSQPEVTYRILVWALEGGLKGSVMVIREELLVQLFEPVLA